MEEEEEEEEEEKKEESEGKERNLTLHQKERDTLTKNHKNLRETTK